MDILEEENDANEQQKFNTAACSVCNKDATDKYISCSEYHIITDGLGDADRPWNYQHLR